MALTTQQLRDVSAYWADIAFVQASILANFSLTDISAAAQAIDAEFDTTLTAATTTFGGTTTLIQAVGRSIPAPFSGATAQQKALLACHVLMKRTGII